MGSFFLSELQGSVSLELVSSREEILCNNTKWCESGQINKPGSLLEGR